MPKHQLFRLFTRLGFFLLYLLIPVFDLFRFNLDTHKFIFMRKTIALGIDEFRLQQISAFEMLWNFFEIIFFPVMAIIAIGAFITWRWGLLYCGWLCPHESVVEIINHLMRRASGKFTLWDRKILPQKQLDGTHIKPHKRWWLLTALVIFLLAFVWAISILSYLQDPKEVYSNLIHASFTSGQLIFLLIATSLFMLEFTFARHLFCRFGCSLGLFQSLVWMLNKKAMVVGFDRSRAKQCKGCDLSCEIACPIQLKPRSIKRKMYSCSQCMRCIDACSSVQKQHIVQSDAIQNMQKTGGMGMPLLQMIEGECALDKSVRDFGKKRPPPENCYSIKKAD